MRRLPILALAAALLAAPASRAAIIDAPDGGAAIDRDAPTVTSRLQAGANVDDKATFHVGDAIGLVVTAISRRNVPVNLPGTLDLGAFTVLDRKESEKDLGDGRVQHEFALTVASAKAGVRRATVVAE